MTGKPSKIKRDAKRAADPLVRARAVRHASNRAREARQEAALAKAVLPSEESLKAIRAMFDESKVYESTGTNL